MITSHKHKFIFVKTRKTAGTSLHEALNAACGPDDIISPTGISEDSYRPCHFRGLVNPIPSDKAASAPDMPNSAAHGDRRAHL